ncbi:uncharacterized protein N7459_009437 [Penicillium hispanicum]|uniref:uncharacterized protein n=1 Tax=Penicillium hispanicum TaxID=1080232 RepID=UPI00254237B2|nr:uncharacterized protein N7459_009437 [Penicillium hispanicum]KAJ5570007.1 hypothetical protein N7459_009437 [Penicillium hispanicum]
MSDVWAVASGDTPWKAPEGPVPEKDPWSMDVQGKEHDENTKPQSFDNSGEMRCQFHTKAECTQPRKRSGGCFNCGEEGHSKADCPNPRKSMGPCFNCGEEGHSKADCTAPRKPMGACFNCGEEGHSKADCPKPRVFKGICRICNQDGHPASECPNKPADICRNCKAEGHMSKDCQENRKFDLDHIADKSPEDAWKLMKIASEEMEISEFREALQVYSKAVPSATFADIEKKMREENFKIHLIALEKESEEMISLIDLQGKLDCQYVVGFFFSPNSRRMNLVPRWPSDPAENIERLSNAGLPYDRQVTKCRNCGELGHSARGCKQERIEADRVEIKCGNCGGMGHRVRDCLQDRRNKYGCRNCGKDDHDTKECPEPRSAANVECRKCNQMGHFAKDCPKQDDRGPRTCRNCGSEDHIARDCDNPSTMTCRNCDEVGHVSRDCPKPRDYSRVKCNRCGEMGHTVKRCPIPEEAGEAADSSVASRGGAAEMSPWEQIAWQADDDGLWVSARKTERTEASGNDNDQVADLSDQLAGQQW